MYIFQDLVCGGDLFSYLIDGKFLKPIAEPEAILIVFQLMQALNFLHRELSIVHRDLKLDNILLEIPIPQSKIYLCDFGIAKYLDNSQQTTDSCVGTIEYCAPEVFSNNTKFEPCILLQIPNDGYNFKCDLWSLGVICHILLSGISPFYADGDKGNMIRAARFGRLNLNKPQFQKITSFAKDFISKLLKVNPQQRMSIEECFEHPWIKSNRKKLDWYYCKLISKQ